VIASYMIVCFLGNSLPVIGVGVLSRIAGHVTAHAVFAATIAVLAVMAAAAGFRDAKTQAQPGWLREARTCRPVSVSATS
jgi:hypothetical protein